MAKRAKAKAIQQQHQKETVEVPKTPDTTTSRNTSSAGSDGAHSSRSFPLETPPTSPGTVSEHEHFDIDVPTPKQQYHQAKSLDSPGITVDDVASNEIIAIANTFAAMKKALLSATSTFDQLSSQIDRMEEESLEIKADGQLRQLQATFEKQIESQKAEVEVLRVTLQDKIKESVEEQVRSRLYEVVKTSVQQRIHEKVREQLMLQIPENLRQQVRSNKRQILQVRTDLHNSEARRYNALQTIPGPHARLRPLLRPLPTPEQSPVIIISHDDSIPSILPNSIVPTPTTAFPSSRLKYRAPAPTPIKRISSSSFNLGLNISRSTSRSGVSILTETIPPTPSHLFPRDLAELFALSQEDTKTLLREYGLDSAMSSPVKPRYRGFMPSVDEEEHHQCDSSNHDDSDATANSSDEKNETTVQMHEEDGGDPARAYDSGNEIEDGDPDIHAQDMNKFMAHIGVPFLMVPAPKAKWNTPIPMSAKSRCKLLTPLIIK